MKTGKMKEKASAKTFSNIPTEFLFDALHNITKIDKFRSTTLVAILCYQISDLRTQMFTEASSISSVNNLLQTNCSLLFKIRFSDKTVAFSTFWAPRSVQLESALHIHSLYMRHSFPCDEKSGAALEVRNSVRHVEIRVRPGRGVARRRSRRRGGACNLRVGQNSKIWSNFVA